MSQKNSGEENEMSVEDNSDGEGSSKIGKVFGVLTVLLCLVFICMAMFTLGQTSMCEQVMCPNDPGGCGIIGSMWNLKSHECIMQISQPYPSLNQSLNQSIGSLYSD